MSTDHTSRLKLILWWIIGVSLTFHVSALIIGHTVFAQWRWIHLPVHAAAEMSGSVIAMMVAWFLFSLHRRKEGTSYNLVIAGALIAMGILDGMHALENAGKIFVWLHSTATFAGGFFFVLIWLPRRWLEKLGSRWLLSIFIMSLGFGLASMIWRDWVPPMVSDGNFTPAAKALNVGGGVLMLLAATRLFLAYQKGKNVDDLLFCLHSTLFGAAAIMFEQSVLWDLPWWGWHLLRLMAYVVALWFILLTDLRAQHRLKETRDKLKDLNVTLEQRVEERTVKLKRSEAESRSIIESSPNGIIVVDGEGRIVRLNRAVADLFGYERDELLGEKIEILVPDQVRPGHKSLREKYQGNPEAHQIGRGRDLTGRHKDGSAIPVEIGLNPIQTAEGPHVLASIIDLTERKRTQEELQTARDQAESANRAKSEFLANMSHEIRTPMNGIIGMSELLSSTELQKTQREYLRLISHSADSLLNVINDVLDFSKIEAGKLELAPHDFNLRDSIGDTLQTLGFRAQEKNLELAYDVHSDVPDCLTGDLGRIRQILVNLVGNALKFTEEGEVVVEIEVDSETADMVSLHFKVKDTGIGIPLERQDAVFDSFTQAEGSTTRTFGGTGLGLTISRRLVNLMNGRIWVESIQGTGSTFHFTVALGVKESGVTPAPPTALKGLPVLVVDDNATNRRILEDLLKNWEMDSCSAASGPEALEMLSRADDEGPAFQLVLLDVMMPEMDGIEVARRIHKQWGEGAPSILVLSSAGESISEAEASRLGVSRILHKPVKQSELMDAITYRFGTSIREEVLEERTAAVDSPMKVLLAEDGRVNQLVAIKMLEDRGHSVIVVDDGQAAVEEHEKQDFDAILMDIQMPRLDGFEATQVIREKEKTTGVHIPIIAMTANAMKGDREKCLEGGMDDYVAKPVRPKELLSTLEKFAPGNGA